ncbi:hypothetical protein GINT2_000827 [Glugoides intestinalis]
MLSTQIQNIKNKMLLDELFYILAGFDTSNIVLIDDPPTLKCTAFENALLIPFEFLILKIREFYRIEEFNCFVHSYLLKLASLKGKIETLEELYVNLQDEIELFKDLDRINNVVLKSSTVFPFSMAKSKLFNINGNITKVFQSKETSQILECIDRWINQGNPTKLVEVFQLDDFISSAWKDLFRIRKINLSKSQLEGIELCGKIVFFIRMIFGIEIIDDLKVKKDTFPDFIDGDQGALSEQVETSENTQRLPPFRYAGDIGQRRFELVTILSNLLSNRLFSELNLIQKIGMMQDGNFFIELFDIFEKELFSSNPLAHRLNKHFNQRLMCTISQKNFIRFIECENTLSEYVTKLLKFQKIPQENQFLLELQRIGIGFEDSILQHFIPRKTYFEMEILFRFLFSINSIAHYFQRETKYNFTRVIYLIFMKLKSERIDILSSSFILNSQENGLKNTKSTGCGGFSIENFPSEFSTTISNVLNRFYLLNSDVFSLWTKLIDISFEYLQIEYKEHILESQFDEQVKECVTGLIEKISQGHGECEFTDFMKNLDVCRYM